VSGAPPYSSDFQCWPLAGVATRLNVGKKDGERGDLGVRDGNFIIVSKEDDFRSLALVRGPPPKVIWLQVGNASTAALANLLHANALLLKTFSLDPVEALLSLHT
jgi:predicted nuclease of predicted toxin-antitoxin system